jgi:hypothetical protein
MTNPIEAAVLPLKTDAIVRAERDALALMDRIFAKMDEHGWDADKAAPRGNSRADGHIQYKTKMSIHNLYLMVTTYVHPTRGYNDPNLRKRDQAVEDRFVENAKETAALQYDMFVAKLISKIGDTKTATITGNHVWGHSILTVETADGTVERWKTQQIVNQSKLGLLFNQWPSRKIK